MTTIQVNSALHPSGVAKSSTSFGWGKGGKVTSAGWQVTLCDLIRHVISRSGVVISITNCYIRFTLLWTDRQTDRIPQLVQRSALRALRMRCKNGNSKYTVGQFILAITFAKMYYNEIIIGSVTNVTLA